MKILLLVFICFQIFSYSWCDTPNGPLVTIPTLGQIRGFQMTSAAGRDFYAYRGIPYAKPPVGDLRFSDPVAADPWLGEVLDATKQGPTCIQFQSFFRFVLGVEDCLKLNVYTHDIEVQNSSKPVMVWIHGGSWYMGSGNGMTDLFGPRYFMDRDVVLVTINYRLGPFGFLSTEDAEAPGNYGLLDQVMALRWVRDHIRFFGGNPDLVTLFGESAGAASVNHHILSSHSKGLFQQAIAQSGSSLNPWATEKSIGFFTNKLAVDLDCPTSSSSELVACLRGKPARDIAIFRKKIEVMGVLPIAFGPRIDVERKNPFLPAEPRELVKEGRFNSVPTIMGLNANEGAFVVAALLIKNGALMKNFSANPLEYLSYVVDTNMLPDKEEVTRQLATRYLSFDKPFNDQLPQIEQMTSDYTFFRGIDEMAQLLTNFSDTPLYYYYYGHRSEELSLPVFMGLPANVNLGVSHTDEIYMMFCNDLSFPCLTNPNDVKVSNILLDLWTSFAKDGLPRSQLVPSPWLPMEKNQTRYLKIEAENPDMMNEKMPFHHRLLALEQDMIPRRGGNMNL